MSDSYSSWKQLLLEALMETDKSKLTELVHAAEAAIFNRLREMENSPNGREESREIQEACATLLDIQVNKLEWPCPPRFKQGELGFRSLIE
jgi:hypothetical protein